MALHLTQDLLERAAALHARAVVVAGHTDFCPDVAKRQRSGETAVLARRHLPVLRKGGISAICDHVAGDAPYLIEFPFRNTLAADRLKFGLQGVEAMHREAAAAPDLIRVAVSADHIRQAKEEGRLAVVLCLEGAAPIEDDPALLSVYHRLGVRVVGLTHDFRNLLADGVRSGSAGGLTDLGRQALREMNRLGMVVDVSHLNVAGFWDVLEHSSAPVHASHSNCADLCPTPRNLTDDMLRALAETGGVVGVHALGALISQEPGPPSFEALLDHLEHMVEVMGEDHVAIGPDLMEGYPAEEYGMLWQRPDLAQLRFTYPPDFDSYSKFPNLTAGMLARGFGEDAILKVLGGNLLRLFEDVWRQPPEF